MVYMVTGQDSGQTVWTCRQPWSYGNMLVFSHKVLLLVFNTFARGYQSLRQISRELEACQKQTTITIKPWPK